MNQLHITHDKKLDVDIADIARRVAVAWEATESRSFRLSEYGGRADVLFEFPEAMARLAPRDPDNLMSSDFDDKDELFEQICEDYREPMEKIHEEKLRQAEERARQIISFLFGDKTNIQIMFQGPQKYFPAGLKLIQACCKGSVNSSAIHSAPDLHCFEGEPLFPDASRILFEMSWSDFCLEDFVKYMIHGKPELNETENDLLTFYIIKSGEPPIVAHIYDDRGMSVTAPRHILRALEKKFTTWIR